ncbi:MAG TPA: hypothetical protein VKU82_13265, partial [Planctomycetaceae bacterium]|nr:hypothetical protein [Planctomycetaceae bacterium]
MKRSFCAMLAVAVAIGLSLPTRADDKDSKAVLDKAIKALGGEAKLTKPQGFSWKIKGIISFGGNDNEFTSATTIQGIDRVHSQFEGEFNGNKFIGVTVLNGDKGWRNFGGMKMELDADALANEKRMIYLQVVPVTLVPLKGKGFKVETAGEEKVDDK